MSGVDSKITKGITTKIALLFLVQPAIILAEGWIPMLALGALHSRWSVVPALGYWETVVVLLGIGLLNGLLRAVKTS